MYIIMETKNTIIINEDEYNKLLRIRNNMKKAQKKWVAANREKLNEKKRECYARSEYQYKKGKTDYYERNKEAILEKRRIQYHQKKEAKQQEQKITEK